MDPFSYPTEPTARPLYRAHLIRCKAIGARPLNFEQFRLIARKAFFRMER